MDNDFNGVQLGMAMDYKMGPWTFNATGKVALGGVHSEAGFEGASAVAILNGRARHDSELGAPRNSRAAGRLADAQPPALYSRVYVGYEFQYLSHGPSE